MPAAAANSVTIDPCADTDAQSLVDCVAFGLQPGSAGWAGVWWHTMDAGWMGPAAPLPEGIAGISFYAWTNQPGLFRKFGVGDGNAGDAVSELLLGIDGINGQQ